MKVHVELAWCFVDGKAMRACIMTIAKLQGKEVKRSRGRLSAFEQEVFGWVFAKAGAVQCGFCIPGYDN